MASPWSRPHQRTITLDGLERAVEIARLTVGRMANMRMCISMLAQQRVRLESLPERSPAEQMQLAREERDVNLQLGQWIEEEIVASLRPRAPWVSESGIEVVDGQTYVDAYDNDALEAAFWAIYLANTLSEPTRKNSSSPRDLADGSPASASPAPGDAPAPTVAPAVERDCATPEDAAALHAMSLSGMTGAPSPMSAPSAA